MIQIPSDILTLSGEPTVLCRFGKLIFANRSAEDILGKDCVGKSAKALFGTVISDAQASSFVADVPVVGRHYILRVARIGDVQAIFFSHDEAPAVLMNDAFICSMRNSLMNIGIVADKGRLKADQLRDRTLSACFASLSKSHYTMMRLLSNISIVKGILEKNLPVTLSAVELSGFLADLVDTISMLRPDVQFHVSTGEKIIVDADSAMLEILVLNLLSNCLVHARGLSRISLSLIDSGDSVVISVCDDGCGIKADELHSVFSRYRFGFDISHLGKGPGLGLTVVRGIAEYHGGTVLLESREGSGTTVRASISKRLGTQHLREPQVPYADGMKSVLIGLSDCLPEACFSDKYMD